MGEKIKIKVVLVATLMLSLICFFQNCSEVHLLDPQTSESVTPPEASSEPSPETSPAPTPSPSDPTPEAPVSDISYNTTKSENPPGGQDPTQYNNWYSDFIYGQPSTPINCQAPDMEAATALKTWPYVIVTGIHGNASNWTGQGAGQPSTLFTLATTSNWDLRFMPIYGFSSFRFKVDEVAFKATSQIFQGGGAGFIYWDADSNSYLNMGMAASISRNPCDLRESGQNQTIFTSDYCSLGNSFNPTTAQSFNSQINFVTSPSSLAGCHITSGGYYYLNILKMNGNGTNDSLVLHLRGFSN